MLKLFQNDFTFIELIVWIVIYLWGRGVYIMRCSNIYISPFFPARFLYTSFTVYYCQGIWQKRFAPIFVAFQIPSFAPGRSPEVEDANKTPTLGEKNWRAKRSIVSTSFFFLFPFFFFLTKCRVYKRPLTDARLIYNKLTCAGIKNIIRADDSQKGVRESKEEKNIFERNIRTLSFC